MTADQNDENTQKGGSILEEMVISKKDKPKNGRGGLVSATESMEDPSEFAEQLNSSLEKTEQEVIEATGAKSDSERIKSWQKARELVSDFRPVPWFVWRMTNFTIGIAGEIQTISDGMVYGMRRLLYAAASDYQLGAGKKINDVYRALDEVPSDVIAAVAVIHAICRRLSNSQFERIWRPILDDALVRARIGWMIGQCDESFGAGRTMLAGFASRTGLAVLIASGELEQARSALEMLAAGASIKDVGLSVYGCEPLQISAMLLMASGCGRESAYGTASYAQDNVLKGRSITGSDEQKWHAAFDICEHIRIGKVELVEEAHWTLMGFDLPSLRGEIVKEGKKIIRRGHDWSWIC